MNGLKIFATFLLLLTASFLSWAQEQEYDNTFGGWNFIEVNHDFKKHSIYLTGYIECDNYQFQRLECVYGRFSVGYMPLKWLKFGLNYVPLYEPDRWKHYIEADLVGTLKSGDFKVSISFSYFEILSFLTFFAAFFMASVESSSLPQISASVLALS